MIATTATQEDSVQENILQGDTQKSRINDRRKKLLACRHVEARSGVVLSVMLAVVLVLGVQSR